VTRLNVMGVKVVEELINILPLSQSQSQSQREAIMGISKCFGVQEENLEM